MNLLVNWDLAPITYQVSPIFTPPSLNGYLDHVKWTSQHCRLSLKPDYGVHSKRKSFILDSSDIKRSFFTNIVAFSLIFKVKYHYFKMYI